MRRLAFRAAGGLCLAALAGLGAARAAELTPTAAGPAAKRPAPPAKAEGGCGSHGTSVEFFDTPTRAAIRARKEQKLVLVLHVSGHFEDPRFT